MKWLVEFLIKRGFVKQKVVTTYAFSLPTLSKINEWKQEDAEALKHFFESDLGIKFLAVLDKHAIENNEWATKQIENPADACGYARGFNSYKEVFNTLLTIAERFSDTAADSHLDRYRP